MDSQASGYFLRQLAGYGLTTVEIHYFLPDHPRFLQLFAFQQYDVAPRFPVLKGFLDYWTREIEGPLHSVRIAHNHLIGPQEWRAVDGIISIH
ncbi:usg protein [Novosphingobium resinovorum]|uniref:Protein usg n=1 Tax=Novosphingobium resinovorum TaxID=158500 RepID=A0A1D8A5D6_9SPHN|nr:usg protein [Novosphingobium resinovorum]AOR77321.1 protein usg [Novosphingobium resinovorum]